MYEILHEYTAGELLDWLKDEVADNYIQEIVEEDHGETYPVTKLDIEAIAMDFVRDVKRYEVVKRGQILYLFDNRMCQDLFSWRFNEDNYEEIQNTANAMCDSLNNRTMRFIGKREKCW